MSGSVKIELDGINLGFGDSFYPKEREVLEEFGIKMQTDAKETWRGWKYGTQYDPAVRYSGQPGTSRDGWKARVTGADSGQVMVLENKAKDHRSGDAYAGHIHRVGRKGTPAWHEVLADVLDDMAALRVALAEAAIESLTEGTERRTLRQNQTTATIFRELVG